MSKKGSFGLTKKDLADLVAEFDADLESYLEKNAKIDLAGLDAESKSKETKKVASLISFEDEARAVSGFFCVLFLNFAYFF